ncbi:MAG: hypothetical protein AAGK34_04105 [Planctomycetota bacterium]|nr:MAG: hypothetical protein CBD11_04165 [Phycisphaera sp. TMED151]RZO56098.1 MAG: hypothetical protein EVA77_02050 [Phycisphaeraceae bacterium]
MPTATWKIGRSTGICALTEQPLGPGDRVVVGLFEDAGVEGYLRRDHQATVWEETYGDQKPEGCVAHWMRVQPDQEAPRGLTLDPETVLQLCDALGERDDAEAEAFRYVLALALLQRRVFRQLRMEQVNGRDCLVLAQKGMPEATPRRVVRPLLTEEDVARIAAELSEVLDGEL